MAGYGKLHAEPSTSELKKKLNPRLKGWNESLFRAESDTDDSSDSCSHYSGSLQSSSKSEVSSESSDSSIVWLPHIEPDGRLFYTDVISERYLRRKESRGDGSKKGRLKKFLRKRRKKKKGKYEAKVFTVLLEITPNRHRKLSNYCHEYLGIISDAGVVQATKGGMLPHGQLVVGELADGCKLVKEGQVNSGDILKSIGKHPVDHSNIELVLQQLIEPCVLALTFARKSGPEIDKFDTQTIRRYGDEGILGFLEFLEDSGKTLEDFLEFLEKYSCTCMLLSVEKVTEFSPEFADIFYEFDLYKFFGGKKRQSELSAIRGSFLTLEKTAKEIFGDEFNSSFVDVNDVPHVVCQEVWGKYTFLLGMPATWCSDLELESKVQSLKMVLEFLFGSPEMALQNEKEECDWLVATTCLSMAAKFFCSNFDISTKNLPSSLLEDFEVTFLKESFPVTSPIPKMVKDQLDVTLYDLEACDVSTMVTSDFENDYVFMLGSLILYKNHLLCTHLPLDLTQRVYNFLVQHRILTVVRQSQVFQIVSWMEVFANREELKTRRPRISANSKWFLLVLVQDHMTLCTIFETGTEDDKVHKVYLEPAMVEELEFVLNEIEKAGIIDFFEKWFKGPDLIQRGLGSKENLIEPLKRKGSLNSMHSNGSLGDSQMEKGKQRTSKDEYRKSYDEEANLSDLSFISDGSSKDGLISSANQKKALQIIIEEKQRLSANLGPCDVFLTFFALDYGRGIVLAPGEYRTEPLNSQLLGCIKKYAHEINEEFESSSVKKMASSQLSTSNLFGSGVQEVGRLFVLSLRNDKKKSRKEVAYWICGRLSNLACRTVTYVCYEDGTPQEAVESGLKLAFSI